MRIIKKRVIYAIVFFCVLIIGWIGNALYDKPSPIIRRLFRIRIISLALSKYGSDHGGMLPDKLSDLIPKYILPSDVSLLFPPTDARLNDNPNNVLSQNYSLLDKNGSYVYLGSAGLSSNIIVIERPGHTSIKGVHSNGYTLCVVENDFGITTRSFGPSSPLIDLLK